MYGAVFSYFAGWLNRLEKSLFGRVHEVRGDRKDLTNTPVLVIRYRRDRVGHGRKLREHLLKKGQKVSISGEYGLCEFSLSWKSFSKHRRKTCREREF